MVNIFRYIIFGISIYGILGMAVKGVYLSKISINPPANFTSISDVGNGKYQFCSEPEPKDWLVGAGVCINFVKTGNIIQGYYGYPHSDNFICIHGQVKADQIIGNAFAIATTEKSSQDIPQSAFKWDREENLTLETGVFLKPANNNNRDRDVSTDIYMDIQWIRFEKALLNIQKFYLYSQPKMTPVSQLCPWNDFFRPHD